MKQQFTYALDEAKIRKQLQEIAPGNADEAWQKFAQYADAQPRQIVTRKLPSLKLHIDRRVLVPAAAALVVIVLAVLLFNVVDFKGSNRSKAEKAVVAEPFVPMPQISEAETILPPIEKRDPTESQYSDNTVALGATKPEMVKEKSERSLIAKSDESPATPTEVAAEKPNAEKTSTVVLTSQAQVKKKKRETDDQVAPLQLPDIRPTLLTDEQVEDIRPN